MTDRRKIRSAGMHETQHTRLQVQVSFPSCLLIKQLKRLRKVSLRVGAERMAKAGVHMCVNLCQSCSAQLTDSPNPFAGAVIMVSHAHTPRNCATAQHPSIAELRRYSYGKSGQRRGKTRHLEAHGRTSTRPALVRKTGNNAQRGRERDA